MARKRAPGGGRKRDPHAAQPLTIRMTDQLRLELQAAADEGSKRNPKWNLSREIIRRLECSLDKTRSAARNSTVEAICFLIADMADRELGTGRWRSWHRNPFAFAAFKAAVNEMLDDLSPSGEASPPSELKPVLDPFDGISPMDKPEQLGTYAAKKEMLLLGHASPLSKDEAATWLRRQSHITPQSIEAFEQDIHRWARIRRLFDITEPEAQS